MKKLHDWVKEAKEKKTKKEEKGNKTYDNKTFIDKDIGESIYYIQTKFGNSADLITRTFLAGKKGDLKLALIYIDGITDQTLIHEFILHTLMVDIRKAELTTQMETQLEAPELFKQISLAVGELKTTKEFKTALEHLLSGDSLLLIDGYDMCFIVGTRGGERRGIEEPSSETVVRGPKDGFTETLRINTALIRRKIKDENLWIEQMKVGTKTKTDIAIVYLKGVVNEEILEELHRRLNRISTDAILESGYIEEYIQDKTYTPFPTVYNTERPDVVASGILEGRIAIIVDGTPFVLLIPAIFVEFFQSSEDYFQRSDISTVTRLLRYLAFYLGLLVPAGYIAVTTFHQEMLPTTFLISLATQREGVPFPAFVEAIIMEITFEILREAGIRMPREVGSAISIVGALVLGEAAVQAGIVSAAMVIVVALTAISNFVIPHFNMSISIRLLRFAFMFLAASFGLFGIILGLIMLVLHLSSLRSFGIPYLTPLAPFNLSDQKDTLVRFPLWAMGKRPHLLSQKNIVRENTPAPTPKDDKNE